MDWQTIQNYLIAIIPSLSAILGTGVTAITIFVQFSKLVSAISGATNLKQFKSELSALTMQMNILMEQNLELKKQLNKTLTTIDHIHREENLPDEITCEEPINTGA